MTTFTLGGDLTVNRLGFGAMRLTGKGVWGPPADRDECIRVLRRAVELGVTFIDTADSYGPYISEELIHEALHPYPDDLVIATKAGLLRTGPDVWVPLAKPAYLRQEVEMSLRRLEVETIDRLRKLHRVDPDYAIAEQVGELAALQREGKIRRHRVSEVDIDTLRAAQQEATIVSAEHVQPDGAAVRDAAGRGHRRGHRLHPVVPAGRGPARGAGRAVAPSLPSTAPRRPSWRWRGCSSARRPCCRSPAPPGSPTSKKTWRRRTSP